MVGWVVVPLFFFQSSLGWVGLAKLAKSPLAQLPGATLAFRRGGPLGGGTEGAADPVGRPRGGPLWGFGGIWPGF